jgi:hypothetical protein
LFIGLLAGGCGKANVNGLLTPDAQRHSYENLLTAGRAAYDRGDLQRALKLVKEAHELDPDAEEAAILYGFVNLSLAHGDPYSLAGGLLQYDKDKPADVSPLTALRTVIGLTDAELLGMGKLDTTVPDLPVIVPACVETVRQTSERLRYLNEALVAVCPFVPVPSRVLYDVRQRCGPSQFITEDPFRALFLWAFAHLSEALAFNGVLTYTTADPTGAKSNLEQRVAAAQKLDTTAPGNLDAVLSSFNSISTTLEAVMPVSGVCSPAAPTTQLVATLYDLLAVDLAFAAMPGIPARMTAAIHQAVDRIKGLQAQGGQPDQKALKADLNKKISSAIASKIDEIQAKNADKITPDVKAKACAAYASISAGVGTPPALCADATPTAASPSP